MDQNVTRNSSAGSSSGVSPPSKTRLKVPRERTPRRLHNRGKEDISLALKSGFASTPYSETPEPSPRSGAPLEAAAGTAGAEPNIYDFFEKAIKKDKKRHKHHSRRHEDRRAPVIANETRDICDPEDGKDTRDPQDARDTRDTQDVRDTRDPQDPREALVPQEARDSREIREHRHRCRRKDRSDTVNQEVLLETLVKFCSQLQDKNKEATHLSRTKSNKSLQCESPSLHKYNRYDTDHRPTRLCDEEPRDYYRTKERSTDKLSETGSLNERGNHSSRVERINTPRSRRDRDFIPPKDYDKINYDKGRLDEKRRNFDDRTRALDDRRQPFDEIGRDIDDIRHNYENRARNLDNRRRNYEEEQRTHVRTRNYTEMGRNIDGRRKIFDETGQDSDDRRPLYIDRSSEERYPFRKNHYRNSAEKQLGERLSIADVTRDTRDPSNGREGRDTRDPQSNGYPWDRSSKDRCFKSSTERQFEERFFDRNKYERRRYSEDIDKDYRHIRRENKESLVCKENEHKNRDRESVMGGDGSSGNISELDLPQKLKNEEYCCIGQKCHQNELKQPACTVTMKQELQEQREALDRMLKLWQELMMKFKEVTQNVGRSEKVVQESVAVAKDTAGAHLKLWKECMQRYETVARDVGDTDARLMEELSKQKAEMQQMTQVWSECLAQYREMSAKVATLKQQLAREASPPPPPTRAPSPGGEGSPPPLPYRYPHGYPVPPQMPYCSPVRSRMSAPVTLPPPPAWWPRGAGAGGGAPRGRRHSSVDSRSDDDRRRERKHREKERSDHRHGKDRSSSKVDKGRSKKHRR